jgi:hypothetical protein
VWLERSLACLEHLEFPGIQGADHKVLGDLVILSLLEMALPVSLQLLCLSFTTKAADHHLLPLKYPELRETLEGILDARGSGQQRTHLEIILLDLLFHILLPIQVFRSPSESLACLEKVLLLILTRLGMFLEMLVGVLDSDEHPTVATDPQG